MVEEKEEESAKAKAEARRRRILDSGQSRMDVVSGEKDATQSKEEGATGGATSRLAQMRKRRFKNTPAKEEPPLTEPAVATAEDKESGPMNVASGGEEDEAEPRKEAETESKKYLGVAKMRRKMLSEQQQQQEEEEHRSKAGMAIQAVKYIAFSKHTRLFLVIHFCTVLLLLGCGLHLGLENRIHTRVRVHRLAFLQSGWNILPGFGTKNWTNHNSHLEEEEDAPPGEEDEFANLDKPKGATTTTTNQQNLDPIFRVDLEQLTDHPGLFFTVARMAVSIHQFLTRNFILVPIHILQTLLSFSLTLLSSTPPIVLLIACSVRFVGKHVLRGSLPTMEEILSGSNSKQQHDNVKSPGIDILSVGTHLAKKYATKLLKGFVPGVSWIPLGLDMIRDVWADMYIVLCGVFIGLIVPHATTTANNDTKDEL